MPHPSGALRRAFGLLSLLLAVSLVLTACSGGGAGEQTSADPTAAPEQPEDDAPPAKIRWPLTGETSAGKLPQRRAVAVKIENTGNSEPQLGLGSADLVVEELVEGGLTRLAAFYYSSMPDEVGPVRSLRATDIGVVKPTRGVLVASGGAPPTMKRVREARIVTATEGVPGYYRVDDRPSPYNLFMNLERLPASKTNGPAPKSYLPWGSPQRLPAGRPAKQVTAQFSPGVATEWTWTGKAWKRADSHAAQGDEFSPDNVLALRVRQTDAGYTDPAGNPVPESVLTGKGPATLFHQGRAYEGTWLKKSAASPLRLVTAEGEKLPVPPGHTWLELIPASGGGGLRFGR